MRLAASQVLGTDQVDLNIYGVDVLISKRFIIAGTARLEPFAGWNMLFIDAQSGVIDATPVRRASNTLAPVARATISLRVAPGDDATASCDAYAVKQSAVGGPPPSGFCAAGQNGTWDDLNANFTFPQQDVITRQRWFGGLKLKLSVLFVVAEYDIVPAGHSHDDKQSPGARDGSGDQQSFSLSAGFDF